MTFENEELGWVAAALTAVATAANAIIPQVQKKSAENALRSEQIYRDNVSDSANRLGLEDSNLTKAKTGKTFLIIGGILFGTYIVSSLIKKG